MLFIKGVNKSVFVVLMVKIGSIRQQFKNASQEIEKKKNPKNPYDSLCCLCPEAISISWHRAFKLSGYVPVKGEIIWYLSLTTWLISLSIMLSSSIHAVPKGISSFFLPAA